MAPAGPAPIIAIRFTLDIDVSCSPCSVTPEFAIEPENKGKKDPFLQ